MLPRKHLALSIGLLGMLSVAALAQQPKPARPAAATGRTLSIPEGTIRFFEESNVAVLRPGTIDKIEYDVGDRVEKDEEIASLHSELAELKVARDKLVATSKGALDRALAAKEQALNEMAIRERLSKNNSGNVTIEELNEYAARVKVAEADVQKAKEDLQVAQAELALAQRELEEHKVKTPFTGYVIERMKNPSEGVTANEGVIRVGRSDKLRFVGDLPVSDAIQVSIGDTVEVQPMVEGQDLEVTKLKLRGKIIQRSKEVDPSNRAMVTLHAEIENPDNGENSKLGTLLFSGMRGSMVIYLGTATAPAAKPVARAAAPATPPTTARASR